MKLSHKIELVAVVLIAIGLIVGGAALHFSVDLNHSFFLYINSVFPNGYLWNAITTLGDGAAAGCLFYVLFRTHNDFLVKGLAGAVVGTIASQGLKKVFEVARPEYTAELNGNFHFLAQTMRDINYSMPSGHTLTTFLMGTFILCSVKLHLLAKIMIVIAMLAVGISRIALGVHWPADVLAGAGLGILIGLGSAALPVSIHNKQAITCVHLLYLSFVVALVYQYARLLF